MCFAIGETLHIARPVVYAALLYYFHRRDGSKKIFADTRPKSYWMPWIISLMIDVGSLSLLNIGNKYVRGCVAAGHPCPDRCVTCWLRLITSYLIATLSSNEELTRGAHCQSFYYLSVCIYVHRFAMAAYGLSKMEQQEIQRRRMLLFFYLLRSPFFDNVAKKPLVAAKVDCLDHEINIPLLLLQNTIW